MEWATVPNYGIFAGAPEGWEAAGFNGNVGGLRACTDGWNAYANLADQGSLSTTLVGAGQLVVTYKDCWGEGFVGMYINDVKIDQTVANDQSYPVKTISVTFHDGDELAFRDEGDNAVVWIGSIDTICSGDRYLLAPRHATLRLHPRLRRATPRHVESGCGCPLFFTIFLLLGVWFRTVLPYFTRTINWGAGEEAQCEWQCDCNPEDHSQCRSDSMCAWYRWNPETTVCELFDAEAAAFFIDEEDGEFTPVAPIPHCDVGRHR